MIWAFIITLPEIAALCNAIQGDSNADKIAALRGNAPVNNNLRNQLVKEINETIGKSIKLDDNFHANFLKIVDNVTPSSAGSIGEAFAREIVFGEGAKKAIPLDDSLKQLLGKHGERVTNDYHLSQSNRIAEVKTKQTITADDKRQLLEYARVADYKDYKGLVYLILPKGSGTGEEIAKKLLKDGTELLNQEEGLRNITLQVYYIGDKGKVLNALGDKPVTGKISMSNSNKYYYA